MGDTASETALCPPEIRQPYTPPPQRGESEEMNPEDQAKHMSGGLQVGGSVDEISFCASPADYGTNASPTKVKRRKAGSNGTDEAQSLAGMLRRGIVEHQLGLSVNLCLLVGLSWLLFPSLRPWMSAFLAPSYKIATSHSTGQGLYGQGPRDLHLALSFVVIFTAIRAFTLEHVLIPVASLLGIRRQKGRVRFAEQGYLLLYYVIYWTWGLYLFAADTPSSLPASKSGPLTDILVSLWTGFPKLYVDASMKLYYLSQFAFWAQQILVIHLEEKRKDHYQMLTHHFVTVALMSTSYGYRQWRVGNAVLVCMDVVDLIFPLAKILKYIGWQTACDIAFALFVVVWLAARHAAYLTICWSIYTHVNEVVMPYGTYSLHQATFDTFATSGPISGLRLSPNGGENAIQHIYQPFLNPEAETVSFNARVRFGFLGLLLGLQCITLMWFVMICRVVAKVLRGEGADDSRSDDEGEGDEEEDISSATHVSCAKEKPKFIEVEATSASDYTFPRSAGSGSKRKSKSSGGPFATGLNLGDRKEILNRIGCLSDEQLAREREKREGSEGLGGRAANRRE